MQSNNNNLHWLHKRGITDDVIALFNIDTSYNHPIMPDSIRIPYSPNFSKYRRNPLDDRIPKYTGDAGGKVTLYGADKVDWSKPVLITEGEFDALVAWSNNIQAVSSTGGARTFKEEWGEHFTNTTCYVCFDNDDTGAEGMVKVLGIIPHARIVLLPEMPGVKDISDYVARGGDLHQLLQTARPYTSLADVKEDMLRRQATWQPVRFHQEYIKEHQQDLHKTTYNPQSYEGDDQLLKAKSYPLTKLIDFNKNKALCLWHNESTPSLHFYPKTNSAYCFGCGKAVDSIEAYRHIHNTSFKEAVRSLNELL